MQVNLAWVIEYNYFEVWHNLFITYSLLILTPARGLKSKYFNKLDLGLTTIYYIMSDQLLHAIMLLPIKMLAFNFFTVVQRLNKRAHSKH